MGRRLASSACLLVLLLASCSGGDSGEEAERHTAAAPEGPVDGIPIEHVERILELFNQGVGLMDRFEPVKAVAAFEQVMDLAPDWTTARLNLGIALLNAQSDEYYALAEVELKHVIGEAPENPYAHYALGMLLRHLTRFDEARAQFEQVLELDPDDADAHYQLGILIIDEDPVAARAHLEQTLAAIPHHESATYRLQTLLRDAGEKEGAAELLRRFRALKADKSGVFSGMKYGEMGRYAEVIRAFDFPGEAESATDTAPTLVDAAEEAGLGWHTRGARGWPGDDLDVIRQDGAAAFGPGLAVADVDGDASLDVFATGTEDGGVLYTNADGRFTEALDVGVDGRDAVGAFFGDYDGDGDPDLYLTCAGPNRLYRNEGGVHFVDVTESSGTAGHAALSVGAAWADADHDGDLDLYIANFCAWPLAQGQGAGAPNTLWRNNGNGTFLEVAGETAIDGGEAATIAVLYFDADADRDLDLYLINHRTPNILFLNDRVGRYSRAPQRYGNLEDDGPGYGALVGDIDQNGWEDLLLLRGPAPPRLFSQVERGSFAENEAFAGSVAAQGGALGGLLGDLDLDGDLDLVLLGAGSEAGRPHRILMNRGGGRFAPPVWFGEEAELPDVRAALAADFDADGALELLATRAGAPPRLWRTSPPRENHWLEVIPANQSEGRRNWIDPAAVGLQVEVKAGRRLQLGRLATSSGYLASPPLRVHFGLGAHPKGDYVRLVWPDAVLQSELEVAADQVWQVEKVVRKPSSCPLLFAWDGESFRFVTDFLGVGGLGFFMEPGQYAPPDPTEDVRIPPALVAPRDGRYLLRIAEPLEEVCYIDQLELRIYDHPPSVELYPDERFTGSPPFPSGRPFAVAERIFPTAARDDTSESVLDRLLEIDRFTVEPPKDRRFVGYAHDHWLQLDFGEQLRDLRADSRLVLYLYGWVEYTFSHVNYAASQAGLTMHPPSIEVPDGQGGWEVAVPDAGYPAGLPRMMTLDVTDLPIRESGRLRIRSNMELFWDQIFLAEDAQVPGLAAHTLRPAVAELRPLGYPREYSPDGHDPTVYDYHRVDHGVPFKNLTGDYTRFGDVRPLLDSVDDRFVIMGRGEELACEFDARDLPALPAGWTRLLVLHSDGYCKDMDLYTAFPDTVEPLPHHGMENYPPRHSAPLDEELTKYRRTWNTRRIVGR